MDGHRVRNQGFNGNFSMPWNGPSRAGFNAPPGTPSVSMPRTASTPRPQMGPSSLGGQATPLGTVHGDYSFEFDFNNPGVLPEDWDFNEDDLLSYSLDAESSPLDQALGVRTPASNGLPQLYNGFDGGDRTAAQNGASGAVQSEIESTYSGWASSSSASLRPGPRQQPQPHAGNVRKRKSLVLDESGDVHVQARLSKLDQFHARTSNGPRPSRYNGMPMQPPGSARLPQARPAPSSALIARSAPSGDSGVGNTAALSSLPQYTSGPAQPDPLLTQDMTQSSGSTFAPMPAQDPNAPPPPVSPQFVAGRPSHQLSAWSPQTVKRAHIVQTWMATALLTSNMFPLLKEGQAMVEAAWTDAQRDGKLTPVFKWKPWIGVGLARQLSNLRQRFKPHVMSLVNFHYGLLAMQPSDARDEATKLLAGYVFHYPQLDEVDPSPANAAEATAAGPSRSQKASRPAAGRPDAPRVGRSRKQKEQQKALSQQQPPKQYQPRGRALGHPAVLAVMRYMAVEDRQKFDVQPVAEQAPDKFRSELPKELYAYALTMIEYCLECIRDDADYHLSGKRYKSTYQRWINAVPSLGMARQASKMAELRKQHWLALQPTSADSSQMAVESLDTDPEPDFDADGEDDDDMDLA